MHPAWGYPWHTTYDRDMRCRVKEIRVVTSQHMIRVPDRSLFLSVFLCIPKLTANVTSSAALYW